jgi:hypothetical protein
MKVNTTSDDLRPEDQFILACLQHQQSMPEFDFDEDLLIHRMDYHRVTSMVYQHLLKINGLHVFSANTQAKLKDHYHLNIGRNLVISYVVKQISNALGANNIETMTLKGAMFLQSFPNYALEREMSDLDIMVKSKNLYQALEVLSTIGLENLVDLSLYNTQRKKWYFHNLANAITLQSKRNDIPSLIVELHWQLFSVNNHINWSEKDLWHRAKYCSEQEVYYLDPIDALLHLCAHQCNDLQIYLYGLVDVANILRFWSQDIDWIEVVHRAKSQKMLLHLVNVLRLSNELLNTPLPDVYFTSLKSYEGKATPGYHFLLERLFQKEFIENGDEELSLLKVFRRLEYSNLWQRLWLETKLLIPQPVRLRLNYHIGRHLPKKD